MNKLITLLTASLLGFSIIAGAQNIATLRDAPLDVEPDAERIPQVENKDLKRKRAYLMQPPTIPHKIDNYQVDLNANQCMSCHSRKQTARSQAPMISVTHYQDLADHLFGCFVGVAMWLLASICQPGLAVLFITALPAVKRCSGDTEVTACPRDLPGLTIGPIEDFEAPGDQPGLLCFGHVASPSS